MDFKAVIPARFASTRLPGKPLADIAGLPMVVRVAQRAQAAGASQVIVATDHAGVRDAAQQHGLRACMTSPGHPSGTDRIAEVARTEGWPEATLVVNVQGDEPLIEPALIRAVAQTLDRHPDAVMSTACHPLAGAQDFANPNVVKVVLDRNGHALYFSRAPIPWPREAFAAGAGAPPEGLPCYRHIGIYGYRAGFLTHYAGLEPAPIERFESLEQLRVLWHGLRIACTVVDHPPAPGVDTPEDLERVRALFDRPVE